LALLIADLYQGLHATAVLKHVPLRIRDAPTFCLVFFLVVTIFAFNAININAGINGIESGQMLSIALALLARTTGKIWRDGEDSRLALSVQILTCFLGSVLKIHCLNSYPASLFVGDALCYFAGMLFIVVGVLSNQVWFVLMLHLPQIFNTLIGLPQFLRLVPCPRHRMPDYDCETDMLMPSYFEIEEEHDDELKNSVENGDEKRLTVSSKLALSLCRVFDFLKIVKIREFTAKEGRKGVLLRCSNLTIMNLMIVNTSSERSHEKDLAKMFFQLQLALNLFAVAVTLKFL